MSKIFETKRLLVREFCSTDLETIHAYAKLAHVVRHQKWGPNSKEDTAKFLREALAEQQVMPRQKYQFAVELKVEQKHVGGCGIFLKGEARTEATIGYILHPDYWNRGYTSEVMQGLLPFATNSLQLQTIKATCDSRNGASKRVLEKSGFEWIDTLENHYEQKGVMRTSFLFCYRPKGK